MSDKRHCDGPYCDYSQELDGMWDTWITLILDKRKTTLGDRKTDYHFHRMACLSDWTRVKNATKD